MITRKLIMLLLVIVGLSVVPVSMADEAIDSRAGRAEMRFLQGMMDHHQMALDMAIDCLDKASTERVVTLCQNIIDAQTPEIALMQGWLLDWYNIEYAPMAMADMEMDNMGGMHAGHAGMNMGPYMDPPMMMGMMAGLNQVEGIDYEIAWLEAMIDHHDDATHMAQRLLARVPLGSGHDVLNALAQKIISDQTAEIELMEALIAELSS